jgi:N-acetylmuramoyl-L-alanine amidase
MACGFESRPGHHTNFMFDRIHSYPISGFLPFAIACFLVSTALAHAGIKPFVHEGVRYVRLEELASFYAGEMLPTPAGGVVIKNRFAELQFKPDSRELRVATMIVWLHEPMIRVNGHWSIREGDALNVVDPIIRPTEYLRQSGSRVVVLDPGHGGQDTGAKGKRGVEEKRAVLDIARRVRSHLSAAGLTVYMTREGDRFIELEERARMAKRQGADLFVSIHLNSAASTMAQGVESFVLSAPGFSSTAGGSGSGAVPGNQHGPASSQLGFQVHRAMVGIPGVIDRGLKRARFIVLRNAPCAAVLVECGFLSHADEERKFEMESYREEVARGIAKGIVNYVRLARQSQRGSP